ncbi:MAG: hypothetical protein INR64_12500 [Caulobacteraceae bacterium]|nr:hypothetical protein [Caulobacter sp.]
MFRLPIIDSALEGFRITRERPWAVVAWAVWLLVGGPTGVLCEMLATLPGMQVLQQLPSPTSAQPEQLAAASAAVARVWPAMLAFTAVGYGFTLVSFTAVMRAVFSPERRDRFFYLRLGPDELRQLALAMIVLGLLLAYAVVVQLVVAAAGAAGPVAGPPLAAFLLAFAFGALVVAALRLSLAPAATFAARRVRLFSTWKLTRGLVWPLLGVYVSALGLAVVVFFLALVVAEGLTGLLAFATGRGIDGMIAMLKPDTSSLPALFSWPSVMALVLSAAINTPIWVVTSAAGVAAYRRIAAARGEPGAR